MGNITKLKSIFNMHIFLFGIKYFNYDNPKPSKVLNLELVNKLKR